MSSPLLPEFFGSSLRVVLPSGVSIIDVEPDLYSQWKEWVKIGDNAKYPPLFRTVGGDPLTPGIDAGAYFFWNNVDGWRLRPAEEDATVLFTGNLAPEDSLTDIAVPTLGGYTVLLLGLQPITQNVDTILDQTNLALYGGTVYIDTVDGTPGTSISQGIGQESNPVSNVVDARIIADLLNFKRYHIRGEVALHMDHQRWVFVGNSIETTRLDFNGYSVDGSTMENMHIFGTMGHPSPHIKLLARDCEIAGAGLVGWHGTMIDCVLEGNVECTDGPISLFGCSSKVAGNNTPVLDKNGGVGDINIRAYSGGIELRNFSQGNSCSMDFISGHPVIGPTNTSGTVVLRGVGKKTITAGSPFVTVNTDGFVDARDIRLIKALTAGDAVVSLDDLTVTIYDPDNITSPRTVLAVYSISADGRIRTRTT